MVRWSVPAVLLVASLLSGCASEQPRRASTSSKRTEQQGQDVTVRRGYGDGLCVPAGRLISGPLTLCQPALNSEAPGRFKIGWVGAQRLLAVKHPFGRVSGHLAGYWAWAAASPDGRTILAQFDAECEIPTAFFIDAAGGVPLAVPGTYTQRQPPEDSGALGWTTDGRAIVFVPAEPGCGSTKRAGVFLVSRSGEREKIAPLRPLEQPRLRPSVQARSVAAVKRALNAR